MLANELVKRQILVEGGDDVVAVFVRLRDGIIGGVAAGVRVARDIEPVAAPAFAILRRGEQTVHEITDGGRRIAGGVGDERLHFLRRGRKAREVKSHPPNEGAGIGIERGSDGRLLHFGEREVIHVVARP